MQLVTQWVPSCSLTHTTQGLHYMDVQSFIKERSTPDRRAPRAAKLHFLFDSRRLSAPWRPTGSRCPVGGCCRCPSDFVLVRRPGLDALRTQHTSIRHDGRTAIRLRRPASQLMDYVVLLWSAKSAPSPHDRIVQFPFGPSENSGSVASYPGLGSSTAATSLSPPSLWKRLYYDTARRENRKVPMNLRPVRVLGHFPSR